MAKKLPDSSRPLTDISFVIPARNEEQHITATLQAILAQRPASLIKEIVVVDNGSTDRTAALVKAFNGRVKLISQPIPGIAHARLAGFQAAGGSLIASIDADTILPADWAAKITAQFQQHPKLAMISGPFHYQGLGKLYDYLLAPLYVTFGMIPLHLLINWLGVSGIIIGGNFAMRRAAVPLLKNFARDITFFAEDCYMAKCVRQLGPIRFSRRLTVKSSARRLQSKDSIHTIAVYQLNLWSMLFRGRPVGPVPDQAQPLITRKKILTGAQVSYLVMALAVIGVWCLWLGSDMPLRWFNPLLFFSWATTLPLLAGVAVLNGLLTAGREIFNQADGGFMRYVKRGWWLTAVILTGVQAVIILLVGQPAAPLAIGYGLLKTAVIATMIFLTAYLAASLALIIYVIMVTAICAIIVGGNELWLWANKAVKTLRAAT